MDVVSKAARELGKNIKRVRRQKHWSQEALADAIDTAQSLVSLIESGQVDTSFSKVVQIARALEVGVPELVMGCYDGPRSISRRVK